MEIRQRVDADIPTVTSLMYRVRASDGYPPYLPADVVGFVAPSCESHAWVATDDDGQVIGHVALHDASVDPILPLASSATGLAADQLAVVARLFVATTARRTGTATRLLSAATERAHLRGQRPVLDVWERLDGAIAFYESNGWVRSGRLSVSFPDAPPVSGLVYVGPEPAR